MIRGVLPELKLVLVILDVKWRSSILLLYNLLLLLVNTEWDEVYWRYPAVAYSWSLLFTASSSAPISMSWTGWWTCAGISRPLQSHNKVKKWTVLTTDLWWIVIPTLKLTAWNQFLITVTSPHWQILTILFTIFEWRRTWRWQRYYQLSVVSISKDKKTKYGPKRIRCFIDEGVSLPVTAKRCNRLVLHGTWILDLQAWSIAATIRSKSFTYALCQEKSVFELHSKGKLPTTVLTFMLWERELFVKCTYAMYAERKNYIIFESSNNYILNWRR